MQDVYVYNQALELVGIVDSYKSLIWASRYHSVGDCEIYIRASVENLALMQKNYYLVRPDADMVCQIKKIEIDTDAENGNYLVVTGFDVKRWLDQRVVWELVNVDGNVEEFVRDIVNEALGDTTPERQLTKPDGARLLYLGPLAGFPDVITEQVSYKNIGEKVREYCQKYGWGYRVRFLDGAFYFDLYQGENRTRSVIFSDDYENLITTKYSQDETHMGNVALVAGEGQGTERMRAVAGDYSSIDRFELYVDGKDISRNVTWKDLTDAYPTIEQGGQGHIEGDATSGWTYDMIYLDIQIVDNVQLVRLREEYPDGEQITVEGVDYYRIADIIIANLPSGDPENDDTVQLRDVIYSEYLLSRGYDKIAEYGAVTTFEGTIEPNITFVYGEDYFLGDLVTISNAYGITAQARIVEIVEVNDDSGYSVQPKFEYISQGD